MGAPRERVDYYYGIAESQYLIGDLPAAERGIEQILRIDPEHLPALRLKARSYLRAGNADEALKTVERLIEFDSAGDEDSLLKALILSRLDREVEAEALIERVIKSAPENSKSAQAAGQLKALLRLQQGRWDEAAAAFDAAYPVGSTDRPLSQSLRAEVYRERTRAALQSGQIDGALEALDQALAVWAKGSGKERLESIADLRLTRARTLAQAGRVADAIAELQALIAQQPKQDQARLTLAALYIQVDQWEALDPLIKPLSHRSDLQDMKLYLEGRSALAKNRVGLARAKFEAAIESLPENADRLRQSLFFYRGLCFERLDRKQEAQVDILNAIDAGFQPQSTEEALLAARMLIRADRAAEAVPLLEIILMQTQANAEVWALLARAHMASDAPAFALSAIKESLRMNPQQVEALALSASLHRRIGDFMQAERDYEKALQLDPDRPAFRYALGLVQLRLGRIPEAKKAFESAALAMPQKGDLQLLHSLLAYIMRQPEAARASLQRYEARQPAIAAPTAGYLNFFLNADPKALRSTDPVARYLQNRASRKEALDAAGIAETAEEAQKQICSAAFWMAQKAKHEERTEDYKTLLQIAIDTGHADLTEWQLANWELKEFEIRQSST